MQAYVNILISNKIVNKPNLIKKRRGRKLHTHQSENPPRGYFSSFKQLSFKHKDKDFCKRNTRTA